MYEIVFYFYFRYLAVKFKEMEEQLHRQKEKGKEINKMEQHVDEEKMPHSDEEEEVTSSEASVDSSEAQIDDEGQSHNIDSAVQYHDDGDTPPIVRSSQNNHVASDEEEETEVVHMNYSSSPAPAFASTERPPSVASSMTPGVAKQHNRQVNVQVESEQVEVIEIKSDGSTGHLIPGHYH